MKQNRRTEHCKLQFDQILKQYRSSSVYLAAAYHFSCPLFYVFMGSYTTHNCYISVGVNLLKMATAGPRQSLKQGKRLHSQTKEIILNVYSYFESLSKKIKGKGAFQRILEATSKGGLELSPNISGIIPPNEIEKSSLHSIIKQGKEGTFNTPESRYRKTCVRNVTDGFKSGARLVGVAMMQHFCHMVATSLQCKV